MTSPRVTQRLMEEGVEVGERTVRRYLAEKRRRAEVYIPLVHRAGRGPGGTFEVTVEIRRASEGMEVPDAADVLEAGLCGDL